MKINSTNSDTFNNLPAFGASASFESINHSLTFGDNHKQIAAKGINSLKMNLSLNFTELTDRETTDVVSFLDSKLEYKTQNYNEDGYFDNKRIDSFDYHPFIPYKNNKFICLSFNHVKTHYNCNDVNVSLQAVAPSILNSVESNVDHNSLIDAKININNENGTVSDNNVSLPKGSFVYQSGDYLVGQLTHDFIVNDGENSTLSFDSESNFNNKSISSNQTPRRHSIYIDNPNDCFYYPYAPITSDGNLSVRMFDFRPTKSIAIPHAPKYRQSTITDHYVKYGKYGLNEDLNTLDLQFDARSDLEAKRILLFLESHLGSRKFAFHTQNDYTNKLSYFYCPSWQHTFIYRDNHSINAKFVECSTI